jgi:hypothetical protein
LPPGRYWIALDADDLAAGAPPPALDLWTEGLHPGHRTVAFERQARGLATDFDVRPGERAVTLRLRGGGPLLLRRIRLAAQPFAGASV